MKDAKAAAELALSEHEEMSKRESEKYNQLEAWYLEEYSHPDLGDCLRDVDDAMLFSFGSEQHWPCPQRTVNNVVGPTKTRLTCFLQLLVNMRRHHKSDLKYAASTYTSRASNSFVLFFFELAT